MIYELKLDLLGGEKVEEILKKLSGLTGALGSGGSIFGGTAAASSSPLSKTADDAARLTRQVQAGTVGVHALGKELKNLGQQPGVSASMLGWLKSAPNKKVFDALWQQATDAEKMAFNGGGAPDVAAAAARASKMRGVLWGSKSMLQGQFPEMPEWLKNLHPAGPMQGPDTTKGIRDVTGKDLAKIAGLPTIEDLQKGRVKGLREVTGKDIAKVMGLPDITSFDTKAKDWKKGALGGVAGLFNPWIGSRILSDVFKGSGGAGGGNGTAKGIFGMGGAMGFTEFYLAFKALQLAFKALKSVVDEVSEAYKRAASIYTNALQTGLGTQFSTKRSLLASIMGVSEQDVFRMGAQLAYLNPRLQQASDILARTATPLTQVHWHFKILETDLSATWALLANKVSPAVMTFVDSLDYLIKFLNKHAGLISKMANEGLSQAIGAALGGNAKVIWDKSIAPYLNAIGVLHTGAGGMPGPQSWMKQLPASHWEHQGLVIGGAQNFARETANNTKDTAKNTKVIADFIRRYGGKVGTDPGSQFGLSMLTNNP